MESGRLSLRCAPLNLHSFLAESAQEQFARLNKNGNALRLQLEHGLPPVSADMERLTQVLINLLSNACRHTRQGEITVGLCKEHGRQVIFVQDTGEGMPDEIQRQAFGNYVDGSLQGWRGGIGLYLCKQIVVAHGGEIWIESKTGQGTSVFIALV